MAVDFLSENGPKDKKPAAGKPREDAVRFVMPQQPTPKNKPVDKPAEAFYDPIVAQPIVQPTPKKKVAKVGWFQGWKERRALSRLMKQRQRAAAPVAQKPPLSTPPIFPPVAAHASVPTNPPTAPMRPPSPLVSALRPVQKKSEDLPTGLLKQRIGMVGEPTALAQDLKKESQAAAAPPASPPPVEKKPAALEKKKSDYRKTAGLTEGAPSSTGGFQINLASSAQLLTERQAAERKLWLIAFSILFAFLALALGYSFIAWQGRQASAERAELAKESAEVDLQLGVYTERLRDIVVLHEQLSALSGALEDQQHWTRFLSMVEERSVVDVYYTDLVVTEKGDIILSAVAPNYNTISKQMKSFMDDPSVERVSVLSARMVEKKNVVSGKEIVSKDVRFDVLLRVRPDFLTTDL